LKKELKVATLGGSNSILKHSYTRILNDKFIFTNKAVGASNSIFSLVQNLKFNLIADNDVLIFEYFVNDCNHDVIKINNIDRIHKTIIEIINTCQQHNTQILFVMIYNIEYFRNGEYKELLSYHKYFELIDKYKIPYIDSNSLLAPHCDGQLETFYQDPTHLNTAGMKIVAQEIIGKLNHGNLYPSYKIDEKGFDGLCLQSIPAQLRELTKNFSNSLINTDYVEINNESILFIEFDKATSILAIEYLCDEYSGYIEIRNTHSAIQKNTLKDEKLFLEKGKTLAGIVTFNAKQFTLSTKYNIRTIHSSDITREHLDVERVSYKSKRKSIKLKIASLLVTNNAKVTRCYIE